MATMAELVCRDLDDRLRRAADDLRVLKNKAAAAHHTTEYSRLDGKQQGVELARSYLNEYLRDMGHESDGTTK